jgi:hypothetical protein
MEAEYRELIESFLALQKEYEAIGFRNTPVYARACRALDWAEKNQNQMVELIRTGENAIDFNKHRGNEN